ncbi:MAG: hypothetical protein ACYC6B_06120 [Thermoleophilia bacterium]
MPGFLMFFMLINVLPGLYLVFFLTRDSEAAGLVDKLIISVILSPLVVILVSFLEATLGVPQNGVTLTINLGVLAVLNIIMLVWRCPQRENYAWRLSWTRALAYSLFAALALFRMLPALDLLAPILHDPISHSEWLKYLNVHHFTTDEQWYPQGLEYFLNYYATFLDASYPRIILISHNCLITLFPVSMFYLGLLTFRGRGSRIVYALIMFTLAARLAQPNAFYFLGGKNSMVFAFSVTPLLLWLVTSVKSRWDYLAAAALVFAAIIIHYPTGFLLLFMLFFLNLTRVFQPAWKWPVPDREGLIGYLSAAALLVVLGAMLLSVALPIYRGHPVGEDRSFDPQVELIRTEGISSFVLGDFLSDRSEALGTWPLLLLVGAMVAFPLLRDGNRELPGKLLLSYAALFLLAVPLLTMANKAYGIFYHVEIRFFLVFVIVVMGAWCISGLLGVTLLRRENKLTVGALVLVLAALFLVSGLSQYRLYLRSQADIETVRAADMDAFAFINDSIKDDKKFLIQIGRPSGNSGIIAGADSGVWIPSFTDKRVDVSFLEFSAPRSAAIFDLYIRVAINSDDSEAIRQLYCDYDLGYIFFGSRMVYFNNLQREKLVPSSYFEKIFDNGAAIYRIKPMRCDA